MLREETQTSVEIRPRVRAAPAPPPMRASERSPGPPRASPKLPEVAGPLRARPGSPNLLQLRRRGRRGWGRARRGYRISSPCALGFERRYLTPSTRESPLHTGKSFTGNRDFRFCFYSPSSTVISLLTLRPLNPVSYFHLTVQRASQIQLVQLGNSGLSPHPPAVISGPSLPSQKRTTSSFQLLGKKILELFSTPLFRCHHSSKCLSQSCLHCLQNMSRICFSSPLTHLPHRSKPPSSLAWDIATPPNLSLCILCPSQSVPNRAARVIFLLSYFLLQSFKCLFLKESEQGRGRALEGGGDKDLKQRASCRAGTHEL